MSKPMTRKNKLGNVWVVLDNAFYSVAEAKKGFVTYNEELGFSKEQISDYISILDDMVELFIKYGLEEGRKKAILLCHEKFPLYAQRACHAIQGDIPNWL